LTIPNPATFKTARADRSFLDSCHLRFEHLAGRTNTSQEPRIFCTGFFVHLMNLPDDLRTTNRTLCGLSHRIRTLANAISCGSAIPNIPVRLARQASGKPFAHHRMALSKLSCSSLPAFAEHHASSSNGGICAFTVSRKCNAITSSRLMAVLSGFSYSLPLCMYTFQ